MPLTGEATPLLARDSKGDRSNNRRSWRFAALTTSAVAIVLATVLLSTTSSPISSVLGLGRASLGQNATNVTMSSTDNVRRLISNYTVEHDAVIAETRRVKDAIDALRVKRAEIVGMTAVDNLPLPAIDLTGHGETPLISSFWSTRQTPSLGQTDGTTTNKMTQIMTLINGFALHHDKIISNTRTLDGKLHKLRGQRDAIIGMEVDDPPLPTINMTGIVAAIAEPISEAMLGQPESPAGTQIMRMVAEYAKKHEMVIAETKMVARRIEGLRWKRGQVIARTVGATAIPVVDYTGGMNHTRAVVASATAWGKNMASLGQGEVESTDSIKKLISEYMEEHDDVIAHTRKVYEDIEILRSMRKELVAVTVDDPPLPVIDMTGHYEAASLGQAMNCDCPNYPPGVNKNCACPDEGHGLTEIMRLLHEYTEAHDDVIKETVKLSRHLNGLRSQRDNIIKMTVDDPPLPTIRMAGSKADDEKENVMLGQEEDGAYLNTTEITSLVAEYTALHDKVIADTKAVAKRIAALRWRRGEIIHETVGTNPVPVIDWRGGGDQVTAVAYASSTVDDNAPPRENSGVEFLSGAVEEDSTSSESLADSDNSTTVDEFNSKNSMNRDDNSMTVDDSTSSESLADSDNSKNSTAVDDSTSSESLADSDNSKNSTAVDDSTSSESLADSDNSKSVDEFNPDNSMNTNNSTNMDKSDKSAAVEEKLTTSHDPSVLPANFTDFLRERGIVNGTEFIVKCGIPSDVVEYLKDNDSSTLDKYAKERYDVDNISQLLEEVSAECLRGTKVPMSAGVESNSVPET
jgi:hypothetical protein